MGKSERVNLIVSAKDDATKTLNRMRGGLTSVQRAAASLGVTFGAMSAAVAVKAYVKQQDALQQLEQRLKSTGSVAGKTMQDLESMASGLQSVTRYGDEATLEMQSLLLTFTRIRNGEFDAATEAIMNVATAMGTDLKSAALQVGKALNDPAGQLSALSRSGIQFSEDQKEAIKTMVELGDVAAAQRVILAELETQFGGAARAARETLGGALVGAQNAMGDLAENIGMVFSPAVDQAANSVEELANVLNRLINPNINQQIQGLTDRIAEIDDQIKGRSQYEGRGALGNLFAAMYGSKEELEAERARIVEQLNSLRASIGQGPSGSSSSWPALSSQYADRPGLVNGAANMPQQEFSGSSFPFSGDFALFGETQPMLDKIAEFNEARYELESSHLISMFDLRTSFLQQDLELEYSTAEQKKQIEANLTAAKRSNAMMAIDLMMMVGNKSKGVALAGLALSKGIALADTFVSTQAAAAAALAPPPLGLGPVAGAPLAAAVEAQGYIRMGLIAATGLVQGAAIASSGGSGGVSGGGTPLQPTVTQPVAMADRAERPISININVHGNMVDYDKFSREAVPAIAQAIRDGADFDI